MKKMKFIAISLALAVLFACKSTPKNDESSSSGKIETSEKIEDVKQEEKAPISNIKFAELSWIIEQISPSFWPSKLDDDSKMFITFHMPVSEILNINDIESIFITSPKDMWLLEGANLKNVVEMDKKEKKLIIKRLHCASGAVPLGNWTVDLSVKDGGKASKTVVVSGLQSADTNKKLDSDTDGKEEKKTQYLVPNAKSEEEVSALAIPVINSVSRDADSLEIKFSVNDKRVKNGYFWFDVPGEIYYRDSGSMIDASANPVNGCRRFSTDGKECYYLLRKNKENASWFSKIVAVHFVVADINRVESPWEERVRSISERVRIK